MRGSFQEQREQAKQDVIDQLTAFNILIAQKFPDIETQSAPGTPLQYSYRRGEEDILTVRAIDLGDRIISRWVLMAHGKYIEHRANKRRCYFFRLWENRWLQRSSALALFTELIAMDALRGENEYERIQKELNEAYARMRPVWPEEPRNVIALAHLLATTNDWKLTHDEQEEAEPILKDLREYRDGLIAIDLLAWMLEQARAASYRLLLIDKDTATA